MGVWCQLLTVDHENSAPESSLSTLKLGKVAERFINFAGEITTYCAPDIRMEVRN
jgi:hypothetical protein